MGSKRDPDNDHFHLILCTDHTVQQMYKVLVIKNVHWTVILKLALLQRWKAYQNKTMEMKYTVSIYSEIASTSSAVTKPHLLNLQ